MRNPNPTVLEFLKTANGLSREQVAAFASWDVFSAIVESKAGDADRERRLPGLRITSRRSAPRRAPCSSRRRRRGTAFATTPTRSGSRWIISRATSRACCISRSARPTTGRTTAATIACCEAYTRTDQYLKELWEWLQAQPEYRGRTHLLITTDHGRGRTPADWRDHGAKVAGASETWMAFVSPSWSKRGEWRGHEPLTASQAAATLDRVDGRRSEEVRRRRRSGGAVIYWPLIK